MLYLTHIVLCSSALISAVASFNSAQDSCAPGEHVFEAHSSDISNCVFKDKDGSVATYLCGTSGGVKYNFKDNTINLASVSGDAGAFTIHGSCKVNGNQVAHIDLHMPSSRIPGNAHFYKGLNRLCDLGRAKDTPTLTFSFYNLRPNEITECGKNIVRPIS